MLQAQLHRKLIREEENLEDLLTSNVFGSVSYLPEGEGIIPILSAVEMEDGTTPFRKSEVKVVHAYDFWPSKAEPSCEPCQPDIVITMEDSKSKLILLYVEAKYHSGKSSEASLVDMHDAPTDQLAKEWDNLVVESRKKGANSILLYVTADVGYPKEAVEEAQIEYFKKRGGKMNIVWLTWRRIPSLFADTASPILKDLVKVLRGQGLILFEGIEVPEFEEVKWAYERPQPLNWFLQDLGTIHWKYEI